MANKAVMACHHVLAGQEPDYISNCGGDWSVTCKADENYEDKPDAVMAVHFSYLLEQCPSASRLLSLPINCCEVRQDGHWCLDYEAYDDGVQRFQQGIVCRDDNLSKTFFETKAHQEFYCFERDKKIAFFRFEHGLIVPPLFSTLQAAKAYEGVFGQYRLQKKPLCAFRYDLHDFRFAAFDPIRDAALLQVDIVSKLYGIN